MNWKEWSWAEPQYFWLLLLVPVLAAIQFLWKKRSAHFKHSYLGREKPLPITWKARLVHLPFLLRLVALAAVVLVLARPQSTLRREQVSRNAIDIVISLDISSSMLAQDFKPDRIQAAKKISRQFIAKRPEDRIGLVIFAGESFTQCPVTTDHAVLLNLLDEVKTGMLQDGTAIGMGLATAVERLKESEAKSKVIILLTDGVNNSGFVDPRTAAEIARAFGVRVYTVGVGTMGQAPFPMQTPFGVQMQMVDVEIDEKLMEEIAETTNGKYFRATNNRKLEEIYDEIDRLEKTLIQVMEFSRYSEEFLPLALIALGALLLEFLLRYLIIKKIP